jgi:hypothetical protein
MPSFLGMLIFATLSSLALRGLFQRAFPPKDKYDQLRKLQELKDIGTLSESEFLHAKQKLLGKD